MPEYFIFDRTISDKVPEEELFNNIVHCIEHNNVSNTSKQYKKIHTSKMNLPTEMNFKIANDDNYDMVDRAIENMQYVDIDTGTLSKNYILGSVRNSMNVALIVFDNDSDKNLNTDTLKSILTFFYNASCKCVEVDVFWSRRGGGGPLFNYLINAVKCALSMCKNKKYSRKIFLKSLPTDNTTGFYKKYGMIPEEKPHGLIPFTRELSVDSARSSMDEMKTIEIDEDLQWLMDNIDVLEKDASPKTEEKTAPKSPEYYIDIDKYKEQKIKNKMENRKRIKTYDLRKTPAKSSMFLQATKAIQEYNEHLNESNTKSKRKTSTKTSAKTRKRKRVI